MKYGAVIGLEVHAQVHTRSKMFCGCPVVADTGDLPPNTYVCPVCLALPGALPVVNRRAVDYGIRTALALNCTLQPVNVFARKSYCYPDLPKGYQISQYALPLARNGALEIETAAGRRRIGITRVHLEEDAGKLYHDADGARVDFNRAGVPLLEIVSAPELHTAEETHAYATTLRDILVTLGVNAGEMDKGMIRFEANVSVRRAGAERLGARTEIKNLNSFRALTRSVAYEIERQTAILVRGEQVAQQTLGWDETEERTFAQRSKEQAHDYRYFPDPDLPPLDISAAWIAEVQAQLPELPQARRSRLVREYALRPADAALLVRNGAAADFFEATARLGRDHGIAAQTVAHWITGACFQALNTLDTTIDALLTPEQLIALLRLLEDRVISSSAAKLVFEELLKTGEEPQALVTRLALAQVSDTDLLNTLVAQVLDAHPQQVHQYLTGKLALIDWLLGQVMQASRGAANPQQARALLESQLEQLRSGMS